MKIDNQDLIMEFYLNNRDKYPGVSFEEFKLSCTTPFRYSREQMGGDKLPVIRLKYFATFLVYEKRAQVVLDKMIEKFKEIKLNPKQYFAKKLMLENFLKQHETEDKNK